MTMNGNGEPEGHLVLPGVKGDQGNTGPRGRQGVEGRLPGGAYALTDRRLLIIYVAMFMLAGSLLFKINHNTQEIKRNNFQSCQDFSAVIRQLNLHSVSAGAGAGEDVQLPNCERLRP